MLQKPLAILLLTAATLSSQVVEGRVIDTATGDGIPDVAIGLFTLGQTAYTAVTGATGRFRIESVKDGSYLPFYNSANFFPLARPDANRPFEVTAGAGPVHLEIEMAPVSKISGRVLDGAGNPVPKATVQFMQPTQLGGMIFVLDADDKGNTTALSRSLPAVGCYPQPHPRPGSRRSPAMAGNSAGRTLSIPA